MLLLDKRGYVVYGDALWDGGRFQEPVDLLPVSDAQVKRDIEALLTEHHQRELPPEKTKKKVSLQEAMLSMADKLEEMYKPKPKRTRKKKEKPSGS